MSSYGLVTRIADRWASIPPHRRDLVFAILWTLATQVELVLAEPVEGSFVLQSLTFAVMTGALAWRRSHPLLAALFASAGLVAQTLIGEANVLGGFIALGIITYSVASYSPLGRAIVGLVAILIGVFTYPVVSPPLDFGAELGNLSIFIGAWMLGRAVRSRQLRAVAAEMKVQEVVDEERGRIARELHDIVAHGVSMMVLQAGAARQTVRRQPEQAEEILETIEEVGRSSINELSYMLGVLRGTNGDTAGDANPTLDSLGQLADEVTVAGLKVNVKVDGTPRALPAGLETSAYRIVQESLTNVRKHSTANTADVVVTYEPEGVFIEVKDNGRGRSGASSGGGHGLVGMRERVSMLGGTVDAGPGGEGGWVVSARIPTVRPS